MISSASGSRPFALARLSIEIPLAAATDERLSPETTVWLAPEELLEVVAVPVADEAAGTWIVWPMISSASGSRPL